ncbi:response regulator [Flavobacterium sp. GT3R68]|uniref:response regulator n=1 Tax=Flavobacterium sp. GT3R68 TaxID=2594437 RepID=UPI000F875AF8|nr:response regulator [Flavobacterium sp. GT3R68]RTY95154.1 response regulator [Flavobacterium sp. GSN2]TRW91104.1 response regulator [Flavobacterium sp. GT3R68]
MKRIHIVGNDFIGNKGFIASILCLLCLCFFFITPSFAIPQQSAIDSTVLREFEKAKKLISQNNYELYEQGTQIINKLEKKLISQKKYDQLLYLYLEISYFHITQYDYNSSKRTLDKTGKVLEKHSNNSIRGEYYEHLAVFYNAQGMTALDEKYTLLSEIYLTKYAPKEKQVDLYYNLTLLYLNKQDWNRTLLNSFKFLKINEETGGDSDQPEIDLIIAESYYNLNQYEKALQYLNTVKKSNVFLHHDDDFLLKSRYYLILGELYQKEKNYKEAAINLKIANDYFKKRLVYRVVKLNKSLNQKRELEVQNIEFQSVIKQNELINENLKYKNYLLALCLITIISLIILSYFQYRNAKFKSSINHLLKEKNALLYKANSELEDALNIKKKLLDTISHELRTPIYTLNGLLYLMKEDKTNYEKNIDQLQASVQNLYNLSGNIIEINVLDTFDNDYIPKKDIVSLRELISKILASVKKNRNNNNSSSLLFDNEIPDKLLLDQAKLYQVLFSLIDNAFKFSKNGNVIVEVKKMLVNENRTEIQFIISDTGIGIAPEIKDKIFDLFIQGSEKINYEYGGSGLGLTLVKKTLALFNKTISIDSVPDKGTKISFSLDFENYHENEKFETLSEPKKIKDPSKIKILLVEDNKINQLITKQIITKKGYVCDVANNGFEACNIVKENDYCLILMDIMMPIMDGFEASDYISKFKPDIPIVALTAISEDVNKELFTASKIKKVLSKPVDVEELYKTVNFYCE